MERERPTGEWHALAGMSAQVREVCKHTPELAQLVVANGGVGALVEYGGESEGNNRQATCVVSASMLPGLHGTTGHLSSAWPCPSVNAGMPLRAECIGACTRWLAWPVLSLDSWLQAAGHHGPGLHCCLQRNAGACGGG